MAKQPWRYDHLTWPEIKQAIARTPQPVVAVPIGAVEDHGAHMSISTDNDILEGILAECGRQAAGDLLILPTIPFGLDEHHMDYPGTIAIEIETTLAYLTQTPTGAICAATTVNAAVNPALVADVLDAERKGGWGSVGHACEYETAMMLHLHPDRVDMSQAERDIGQLKLKYFNWDYPEPSAYSWQDWWSRFSRVGVCGDAAAATPAFGKRLFDLTVERFVEMAREFRTIPIRPRVDHH